MPILQEDGKSSKDELERKRNGHLLSDSTDKNKFSKTHWRQNKSTTAFEMY